MLRLGDTINARYEIIDLMHEGGQCTVARAIDHTTDTDVTVKTLLAPAKSKTRASEVARLKRAASLRFNHPHIQDPIDSFSEDDDWFLILPYCDGQDLAQVIQSRPGPLPESSIARIVDGLGQGFEAIHASNVVHRDIKPQNILIDADGNPVIIDFGICRLINGPSESFDGDFSGSLPFIAPEQLLTPGNEDERSDLYSLGTVLYYISTGGKLTFAGSATHDIVQSICRDVPPPPSSLNPSLSTGFDAFCLTLLAKEPTQRFQSAGAMLRAWGEVGIAGAESRGCVSCGQHVNANSRYCPSCGALNDSHMIQAAIRCLACGEVLAGQRKCPGCLRCFGSTITELHFTTGPLTGSTFCIPDGTFTIGRQQLCPRDPYLSREQAKVRAGSGLVEVVDAGSANKTFIGSQRAAHWTPLDPQSTLRFAGNTAIVRFHSN